jgi:hypothetical protein
MIDPSIQQPQPTSLEQRRISMMPVSSQLCHTLSVFRFIPAVVDVYTEL